MVAVAAAALLVFSIATLTLGVIAFQHGAPGGAQQLESYSGVITTDRRGEMDTG